MLSKIYFLTIYEKYNLSISIRKISIFIIKQVFYKNYKLSYICITPAHKTFSLYLHLDTSYFIKTNIGIILKKIENTNEIIKNK